KRAYCLKTQPATGETYPKSDLFNKAKQRVWSVIRIQQNLTKYVNISLVDYEYKTNITHPAFPCYQRGWDGIRCFRYRAGWLVLFFLSK
ncbi:hypothetical protein NUU75_04835, partial [Klebsiella pneumoniae]|uniref:hypothetical protein n=1 Tax=Klebsiella pneumoniae TaxID=573 RepID=UPI0027E1C5F5